MTKETAIKLFENNQVRTHWDEELEKWYFAIVDIVGILSESIDPQSYWRKLKQRLKAEGNETVTNCHALKMPAVDGKMRMTDVADTEQLFRIIQKFHHQRLNPLNYGWLVLAMNVSMRLKIQKPELIV